MAADPHAQALAALLEQWTYDRFDFFHNFAEVQQLTVELQAAFADRRRAQQVLNQPLHPQRAAVHGAEHALDLFGIEVREVLGKQLR